MTMDQATITTTTSNSSRRIVYLYSSECIELLKQAAQKAESDVPDKPIQSIYHQPWLHGMDEESTSSSSDEDEESLSEQHDKLMPLLQDEELLKPSLLTALPTTKQPHKKKSDANHQLGTPPYHDLPLEGTTVLSIPSVLLSTSASASALALAETLCSKPVFVLLLRSGRLAAAVFSREKCMAHRASTRYTIRKGQGKAQSTQDSNRRAKSIGSQLRRQGELALREDVVSMMKEWNSMYNISKNAGLILTSVPKTMKKEFFQDTGLDRDDERIRSIPLDTGRPTFDTVVAVHEIMMRVYVGEICKKESTPLMVPNDDIVTMSPPQGERPLPPKTLEEPIIPLSPMHEFARDGNVAELIAFIDNNVDDINVRAGKDLMTPLHYAASNPMAAACVTALLVEGRANPCLVDARYRVPYFLATHDKVRDAFRMARATLGEDYCAWDLDSKVGPALTLDDLTFKKAKAAEKKKRQKARQREEKLKEKAIADEAEKRRKDDEARQQVEVDAKRIRDGLLPKSNSASNMCDFCQTICRGKRRNQMFQRLDYAYCSTECVNNHKRELIAAAAMARFGK